ARQLVGEARQLASLLIRDAETREQQANDQVDEWTRNNTVRNQQIAACKVRIQQLEPSTPRFKEAMTLMRGHQEGLIPDEQIQQTRQDALVWMTRRVKWQTTFESLAESYGDLPSSETKAEPPEPFDPYKRYKAERPREQYPHPLPEMVDATFSAWTFADNV